MEIEEIHCSPASPEAGCVPLGAEVTPDLCCLHEAEVLCLMMHCLARCICVAEIALQSAAGEL